MLLQIKSYKKSIRKIGNNETDMVAAPGIPLFEIKRSLISSHIIFRSFGGNGRKALEKT